MYYGPCPIDYDKRIKPDELIGQEIIIEYEGSDHVKEVIGIESFCIHLISKGTKIGVLVK